MKRSPSQTPLTGGTHCRRISLETSGPTSLVDTALTSFGRHSAKTGPVPRPSPPEARMRMGTNSLCPRLRRATKPSTTGRRGEIISLYPGLLLLLALALWRGAALAQYASFGYVGDTFFLTQWASSLDNWPVLLWQLALPPCPSGNWVGVSCNTPDGLVTSLDLRFSSLPLGVPRLRGTLGFNLTGLIALDSINLDGHALSGPLPPELSYSPSLKSLSLQGNRLAGPIPAELCLLGLSCLHLANNSLSGGIPPCLRRFPCADFAGNRLLNFTLGRDCQPGPTSCAESESAIYAPPPPPIQPCTSGASLGLILGVAMGSAALLCLAALAGTLWYKHRQRRKDEQEDAKIESEISTRWLGALKRFSLAELREATNSFDGDNLLGEGGHAAVFKARLRDGQVVAVKRMKASPRAGRQGQAQMQFLSEVEVIGSAVHRHVLHAVGFCVERTERLLVLPFMRNGSVASRTRGKEGDPLGWAARQNIARGAAEGVAYLHEDVTPPVIHRDIKAANVLLAEGDEPKIADFGLAKEIHVAGSSSGSRSPVEVQGTLGHIAPECFELGEVSEKADVYAFGVFLLELVSGKDVRQLAELAEEEVSAGQGVLEGQEGQEGQEGLLLRDWVLDRVAQGHTLDLVDPEMDPLEYSLEELHHVLQVALVCLVRAPGHRPRMSQVAKVLVSSDLAAHWEQWQAEARSLRSSDVADALHSTALSVRHSTTGVSLDEFELSGPR